MPQEELELLFFFRDVKDQVKIQYWSGARLVEHKAMFAPLYSAGAAERL